MTEPIHRASDQPAPRLIVVSEHICGDAKERECGWRGEIDDTAEGNHDRVQSALGSRSQRLQGDVVLRLRQRGLALTTCVDRRHRWIVPARTAGVASSRRIRPEHVAIDRSAPRGQHCGLQRVQHFWRIDHDLHVGARTKLIEKGEDLLGSAALDSSGRGFASQQLMWAE